MLQKKTLILGATTNADRYAYMAAERLTAHQHPIVLVGIKKGEVVGQPIDNSRQIHTDIDTLTLYVGPQNQPEWYDYILQTKPQRLIFNPGTENPELAQKASQAGIEVLYACTLVMLSTQQY
ncbi:CoA-binding protein [Eisenibacter elegans]|jgi:predicted CoA-binding protein|uniref:CoA-binding protein n=1 Tax=Eisenibacter elegans TaxID=997 RepID=UPI000426E06C|nr:CoA-binding protein [Eisenibacter elegans]